MQESTPTGHFAVVTRTRHQAVVWFGSLVIALVLVVVVVGIILTDPDRLLLPGFAIFVLVNGLHMLMSSALIRAWREGDAEDRSR